MRHRLVAVGLAAVLVVAFAPSVAATTTRTPYQVLSSPVIGFQDATYKVVGETMHADGMVLVMLQDADVDMLDGVFTVTMNYFFGGTLGDNLWGTETLASSLYPGEGFTCTAHGGWDKDGYRHVYDHCFGYGSHLTGWQTQSELVTLLEVPVSFSGEYWHPGQ